MEQPWAAAADLEQHCRDPVGNPGPCVLCCLQDNQPTAAPMSEEEREQLLRHLKAKWAAVNAEYQKLGFVMDIGAAVMTAAGTA